MLKVQVGPVGRRAFSFSLAMRMPRVVRDRRSILQQEEEDLGDPETGTASNWSEFMQQRQPSKSGGRFDVRVASGFGNIRMDKDNVSKFDGQFDPYYALHTQENEARLEQKEEEKSKLGNFYTETAGNVFSSDTSHDKPELVYFEDLDEKYTAFKPLSIYPVKEKSEPKNVKTVGVKTVKERVVKSKVKTLDAHDEKVKENESSDLNYFDELAFKDSLEKFSAESANTPRTVLTSDYSLSELNSSDLNEIDRQFFGENVSTKDPLIDGGVMMKEKTAELKPTEQPNPQDLDFIDQQFFTPTNSQLETPQAPESPEKELEKPQKVSKNPRLDEKKHAARENADMHVTRKKRGPKAFHSPALEYVRALRSSEEAKEKKLKPADPVDEIGRHVMSRLQAATFTHNTDVRKEMEEADTDKTIKHSVSRYSPPDLNSYTSVEVEELLKKKVLYDDNELVALWKPYGLPMFNSSEESHRHSLERYLPFLAKELKYEKLMEVHRLDKTTTGIVLLATSEARRKHLKQMMAKREIVKTYYAITNGVPSSREGVINIPIGEGKVGDRFRSTLRPDYRASKIITHKKNYKGDVRSATTEYRVLSANGSAALVECLMVSGIKHQIRIHLGLALGTPILGDSKYSWPDRMGPPQRTNGDIITKLKLERSKTRNLPIFLHARRVSLPGIIPDQKLTITAAKPHFFNKTQSTLKLSDREFKY